MAEGDVLHVLIDLRLGSMPAMILNTEYPDGTTNAEEAPGAPIALDASDIIAGSFYTNWNYTENATGYYLDVATDISFTTFLAGYENLDVGFVNEYEVVDPLGLVTYYYRVRAYNDYGTSDNSNIISLTSAIIPILDFDGNTYTYVTIGTQQWLVENFRCTHYIDGTAIPNLTLAADWIADATGAYVWYNNNIVNKAGYGALYNWFAVDNAHELGITGWRVPLVADFVTLSTFLGGDALAGGILKETGTTYWSAPNVATNDYGFNLRGGGYRDTAGSFGGQKTYTALWSGTTGVPPTSADNKYLVNSTADFNDSTDPKKYGFSVRLMRDVV